MNKRHIAQNNNHFNSLQAHFLSQEEDDQLSKITMVTPRQNQDLQMNSKRAKNYPLQQIPQNTMEMYNSDRKNVQLEKIPSRKQSKENASAFQLNRDSNIMVNEMQLKKYVKSSLGNNQLNKNISGPRQDDTINTASRVDSKKNKFWTKKGVSSDLSSDNTQHNRQSSQNIRQNSLQRKNNIKIKQRNCLSVCSVPPQTSNPKHQMQKQKETVSKFYQQSQGPKKFDQTIQSINSQQKMHNSKKQKMSDNKRISSMKIRTQPQQDMNPHLKNIRHQNHQESLFSEDFDHRNKFSLLLENQHALQRELQILMNQKSIKLMLLSNFNRQLNKNLELTIKVLENSGKENQSLAQLLTNHLYLSQIVYEKTNDYCRQWVHSFDYEDIMKKSFQISKENEQLKLELHRKQFEIMKKNGSDEDDEPKQEKEERETKIDLERLYLELTMNPLKICESAFPKTEIKQARFEQICCSLVQKLAYLANKQIRNIDHQMRNRNKENAISHQNRMNQQKCSVFSIHQSDYSENKRQPSSSNCQSISVNRSLGSVRNRSIKSIVTPRNESVVNQKHESFIRPGVNNFKGIGIYQWEIFSSILPIYTSQRGEANSKVFQTYFKEGIDFIKKIRSSDSKNRKSFQIIRKILMSPFIEKQHTDKFSEKATLMTRFEPSIFSSVVESFMNCSKQLKISVLLHFLNKFSFLHNKQTCISLVKELDSEIGEKFQWMIREQTQSQQNEHHKSTDIIATQQTIEANIISNKRLINCMKLYESKIKINNKSNKSIGESAMNFNFNKKYNKSIQSITNKSINPSNRYLESIIGNLNEESDRERSSKKGVAFFQSNKCEEMNRMMNMEVELGEGISLVYLYIEQQFNFIYKVMVYGRKSSLKGCLECLREQIKCRIHFEVLQQIENLLQLQKLNCSINDYINSEKSENWCHIIGHFLKGPFKQFLLSSL